MNEPEICGGSYQNYVNKISLCGGYHQDLQLFKLMRQLVNLSIILEIIRITCCDSMFPKTFILGLNLNGKSLEGFVHGYIGSYNRLDCVTVLARAL